MRLLAICPRISRSGERIEATTAWRLRLLTLGMMFRRVVIDPQRDKLLIESRWLWLIRRRRVIRFARVQAITYGYEDLSPDGFFSLAHDSYDSFTVGLRLMDDSEVRLFTFHGDGTFVNTSTWPDWLFWDEYALDLSGSQQQESRLFVDLLSEMIGVSVVPPRT